MTIRIKASARVRLVVEVQVDDAWGGDCTLGQVHAQAIRSAEERLRKAGPAAGFKITGVIASDVSVTCEEPR